ncbi:hypothetical protein ES703_104775 [subsurface metagenome]
MTAPISLDDLNATIKYHQDSLASHRWQMSPSAEQLEKQTILALEHYRDLLAIIDNRPEEPEPLTQTPSLPPLENAAT